MTASGIVTETARGPDWENASKESFANRLSTIDQALTQGKLLTDTLEVVEKNGIKWAWIVLTRAILDLLQCGTQQDPWGAYRIDSVAKALATFAQSNQHNITAATKNQLEEIVATLQEKAGRSQAHKEVYIQALDSCLQVIGAQPYNREKKVQKAICRFGNDVFARISALQPAGKSFSFSPLSVMDALSMCLYIIKPEKKELFLEKMGLQGFSEAEAHAALAAILKNMTLPKDFEEKGMLTVAQGLTHKFWSFADNPLAREPTENDMMEFVKGWVADKCRNASTDLPADGNDSSLALLNSIQLTLEWKDCFKMPPSGWRIMDFTCADGSKAPTFMMMQRGSFFIYYGDGFSMLEKPYLAPDGRTLSQLIFLPYKPENLGKMEAILANGSFAHYRSKTAWKKDVELYMPKTRMANTIGLLSVLKEMGLPLDHLDESIVGPGQRLSDVLHEADVKINDLGTGDAAASEMDRTPTHCYSESFHINHCYAYAIVDGNVPLIMGRVSDKESLEEVKNL